MNRTPWLKTVKRACLNVQILWDSLYIQTYLFACMTNRIYLSIFVKAHPFSCHFQLALYAKTIFVPQDNLTDNFKKITCHC